MKKIFTLSGALILVAAVVPEKAFHFEKQARNVAEGRSPKLLARRQHGVLMIYTGKGPLEDRISSSRVQPTSAIPSRMSAHKQRSRGSVRSWREQSAATVVARRVLCLCRLERQRFRRLFRFACALQSFGRNASGLVPRGHRQRRSAAGLSWFPDSCRGTRRNHLRRMARRTKPGIFRALRPWRSRSFTGGTSDLYLSRSTDGGKTFQKNVRIARNLPVLPAQHRVRAQPCHGRLASSGTGRSPRYIRCLSSDKGQTWAKPILVARDSWKIKGCPHCGPSLASMNDRLYVTWFTEGSGKPVINLSYSDNGGGTFAPKQPVSTGTADPTRPFIASGETSLQSCSRLGMQTRKPVGARWVSTIARSMWTERMSKLIRAGEGKSGASYPTAAIGMSGRVFLGWTETVDGKPGSYLLRGRLSR